MCTRCKPDISNCLSVTLGWEKGPTDDDDDAFTVSTMISEQTFSKKEKPRRCSEMIRRCFTTSAAASEFEMEEENLSKNDDETTIQRPVLLESELDLKYAGETIRWQSDEEEEKERTPFCFICLEDFVGNEKVVKSKCSRSYHQSCMLDYVKEKNKTCPDCNASIWDHIEFEGMPQSKYDSVPAYSGNLHNLRRPSLTTNQIRY